MRLQAPMTAPPAQMIDIYGQPVEITGAGKRTLLSFFREANCPFCNFRVYELTHNHKSLSTLGLDVIAVFSSPKADVMQFIARQPRPFLMVADPDSNMHNLFGIERSLWGKLKAMMIRLPAMMKGMGMVGLAGMKTGSLMPADFLIDENGRIVEAYYGSDAGDHIPMERIELFLARGIASRQAA
ncbi:MAG: alkyl hydroperoxide reductase [Gammaproteobacteria bacterium RIFCSPHIGHO2_12_FULL_63_22]|nr:MAG: alkyl hydroperoxide reductase [Gammaproteobacteria bacterium RIFCSPHIGHO2_12_FULL_63_22]